MKIPVLCAAFGLTLLVAPATAQAQGIVRGAEQGAAVGNRAAGPVGGAVGGAVGGIAGGVAGGVKGVLNHPATHTPARKLCEARRIKPVMADVHDALAWDDVLAAGMARLLLYSLPDPLPTTAEEGWRQYVEAWRPGKPHPEKWPQSWGEAGAVVAA